MLGLRMSRERSVLERLLLSEAGKTLRFLHECLQGAEAPVAGRICYLLRRLGHPIVLIPGADAVASKEHASHTVSEALWIDKYPTTNAQYAQFVRETAYAAPNTWARGRFPEGQGDHPVVMVTWEDAMAYCRWAGKALPTEAQWEEAAGGAHRRRYPWGDLWDRSKCCCAEGQAIGTAPVGAHPEGVSPYGCHDMVGNVWEWCKNAYTRDVYVPPDPVDEMLNEANKSGWDESGYGTAGGHIVYEFSNAARGGSWATNVFPRGMRSRDFVHPEAASESLGFRCVLLYAT